MATNSSEKQKTLYDMFQRFPSDIWTLDNLQTYCNYNNISIMPLNYILDDYKDYFEVNGFLKEVELPKKYWYSPAMFAYDTYGTADLDFMVLYFAKKTSIFEFNTKKIQILDPERIKDINRIIVANKEFIKENKKNPPKYIK